MASQRKTVLERLAERSEWQGDCLVWTGYTNKRGYGSLNVDRKPQLTHRLSWLHHFGPPPESAPHVLHRCDNPPCWNPEHLRAGTHAQNMRDLVERGNPGRPPREACVQGHRLEGENVYVTPDGRRQCVKCQRQRVRDWRARH